MAQGGVSRNDESANLTSDDDDAPQMLPTLYVDIIGTWFEACKDRSYLDILGKHAIEEPYVLVVAADSSDKTLLANVTTIAHHDEGTRHLIDIDGHRPRHGGKVLLGQYAPPKEV